MKPAEDAVSPVLILTPVGRDAELAAAVLSKEGIASEIRATLDELLARGIDQAGAIVLSKEALVEPALRNFVERLNEQPAWSDLPLLVLTHTGYVEAASVRILNLLGPHANVTLIERPLRSSTLISTVRVALRARRRQYEVRDLIREREAVLSSISDAFSAIDRDWRYTYVNDRVAELAGIPKEKMLGRNIWEIFPGAVGGEFYHLAHEAMEKGISAQSEFYHQPWKRWLDTRIYPTKNGIVVFRGDVTEKKQQEILARERDLKLQESQDLLRLATEAADIGTFDFYPQSGELHWSERCKRAFGMAPETEVNYDTYIDAVHPEDRPLVQAALQRVREAGSSGRYDIEYRAIGIDDEKERWVSEKGRVILDRDGAALRYIGTMLDITERKTAEIVLQRAKQEAEEANRAKDQFLAMLSHELRTPLTPVLMTIASLRRQPDISDELRADLEVLQRNVELESLLIDDLLDLTRIAHGKLELHNSAVDIHSALDHALSISSAELEQKQLKLTRDFAAEEHHCWADGARLQQVFWNLIKNAIKFTATGGTLRIVTGNEDGQIVVEVTDSGIGIEPELMPRIFDAFEQGGRNVTSQYGGLGLGLAISKRVIDMHGGTIQVESAGRGQGASFTVKLKAMRTSMLTSPEALPNERSPSDHVSILLVEDHADTARVLSRVLESAGYSVAHAESLARAREVAAKAKFDLVVSDLGLPDGSGLDLMRHLRSAHALGGIALSGYGTDDDRAASLAAGFAEHLTKPVDWPQLRAALERFLSTRAPRSLEKTAS